MDTTEILVVGAGAVGLAVGARLARAGRDVVVVERHERSGCEQSSRNSEVIHAGLYYPQGSLKARLCVEGNRRMYEFCGARDVAHQRLGKLVIGNTPAEIAKVQHLLEQGNANGVEGLRMLTRAEIAAMEPHIRAAEALWSPATGIFDSHAYMARLEHDVGEHGGTVAYCCELVALQGRGPYEALMRDADGAEERLGAQVVINAAGLGSDRVAAMAGIDIDAAGYRIHPCKGEYFAVSSAHRGKVRHLVYPAPTPISLGIHTVLDLGGRLRLGPNAFYVDKVDYDVDPGHTGEFEAGAADHLPFVKPGDLTPDMAGVRAKLQRAGEEFHDFAIAEESTRGLPGLVNLVGIESPGLTSSLAIAEHVAQMVAGSAT
jgi:L-2-hydroxyglutarate oxidase LhgO